MKIDLQSTPTGDDRPICAAHTGDRTDHAAVPAKKSAEWRDHYSVGVEVWRGGRGGQQIGLGVDADLLGGEEVEDILSLQPAAVQLHKLLESDVGVLTHLEDPG